MKTNISLFLVLSLFIFSCKSKKNASNGSNDTSTETEVNKEKEASNKIDSKSNASVLYKKWKVIELFGEIPQGEKEMLQKIELSLTEDGQLRGSGGCNNMFGSFTLNGKNFIKFGEVSVTEMACEHENYDEKLSSALLTAEQFITVGENELHLIVGKRAPLAKFKANSEME